MGAVLVMVNGSPSGKVTIYKALQFVLASLDEGHSVEMYLEGEAVLVAQQGHETVELSAAFDKSIRDCKELMKVAIARGAKVMICEACAKGKSLEQNQLYEGVEIAPPKTSMKHIKRWFKKCDKMAFFTGDSFECKTKEEIEKRRAELTGQG